MGGVDPVVSKAQRVHIHTADGPVLGVIGNVAPHLTKSDGDKKYPKIEELFVDIGVGSRKEAEKVVRIGNPMTLVDQFEIVARGFGGGAGFRQPDRDLCGGRGVADC
jgi:putative aminopeptidase FrvX